MKKKRKTNQQNKDRHQKTKEGGEEEYDGG